MSSAKRMPHTELAPLLELDPERLIPSGGAATDLQRLMIAFSVVFNDLKGVMLFQRFVTDFPPEEGEHSAYKGQYHGLIIQTRKLMCGIIHEFLGLVSDARETIGSRDFTRLLKRTPKARQAWSEILAVATEGEGKQTSSNFAQTLLRIRNNFSFHYRQHKPLARGFRSFFYDRSGDQANRNAAVSLGKTPAASRFYYADAATQYAIRLQIQGDREDFENELKQTIHTVLVALGNVLNEYHEGVFRRA